MNLIYYTDPIDRLHQADFQYQQLLRFWNPWQDGRNRLPFSQIVENYLVALLQARSYQVNPTTHSAPFDLWVSNCSRAIKIEIKAARPYYRPHKRSWTYQANIRNYQADLLVFICVVPPSRTVPPARAGMEAGTGLHRRLHHFIIPVADLGHRQNISIWSRDPKTYTGRWAPYLEAWCHLDHVLFSAPLRPRQQILL